MGREVKDMLIEMIQSEKKKEKKNESKQSLRDLCKGE